MSADPRKHQKKLEKQKAKKKAERKEIARRESQGMAGRLESAAAAPILHCCHADVLWTLGIGNVLVSRQLSGAHVAFTMFLVDVYCLGVKEVFFDILPRAVYDSRIYDKLLAGGPVQQMQPGCARKLVEGAVEYARRLELPPHADYRIGKSIFGGIAAESCEQEFVYGREGKPFFANGPFDDAAHRRPILHTLERVCGPGGFGYLIDVEGPPD